MRKTSMSGASERTFLYFAYGSNLLKERIRINNTSAVFKTVGRLDGYHLDFDRKTTMWHGCAATIIEDKGTIL